MYKSGFTLMELLVVLFILSLLSALVMPRLSTLFARVDAAFARDEVLARINALGYQAQRRGRGFRLQHYPPIRSRSDDRSFIDIPAETPQTAAPADEIPLQLPDGWRISSSKPIDFFSNGACSGGELLLSFQNTQYRLTLTAPFCQARIEL